MQCDLEFCWSYLWNIQYHYYNSLSDMAQSISFQFKLASYNMIALNSHYMLHQNTHTLPHWNQPGPGLYLHCTESFLFGVRLSFRNILLLSELDSWSFFAWASTWDLFCNAFTMNQKKNINSACYMLSIVLNITSSNQTNWMNEIKAEHWIDEREGERESDQMLNTRKKPTTKTSFYKTT